MNSPATDTLSSNYDAGEIRMRDGTIIPVLMKRLPTTDGSVQWAIIDDRVMAFEAAQAGTEFKAESLAPSTAEAVTRRSVTITVDDTTKRHISGDLIQFLGDPDRIIAQQGLDSDRIVHMKAHPASLTMARRLCQIGGPKWQEVLKYLPKIYPGGA